ncbi:MAG TPA: DUF4136 domain-containing protein [Rhodocyclaceae bacterium]
MLRLLVLLSLGLLTGCAGLVKSNIVVFHELPPSPTAIRYAALPLKDQQGSLEHKSYEKLIKDELNKRGFVEVAPEQADVALFFSYGVDSGKEVVSSYPIFGQTGTSSSYTSGTVTSYGNYATYSGTTYNTPTYGVVGSGVSSHTEFSRFLNVELLDMPALRSGTIKKVYEAKVGSAGSNGQVAVVMPTMIKALFEDFPGKSGSTRKSMLPVVK